MADDNIKIQGAAFASKINKGRIKLQQPDDLGGGRGAFGGGAIGIFAGTLVAGPVGAAIGGALGTTATGLYTSLRDSGINNRFMKEVSSQLNVGETALFIVYSGVISEEMVNTLREYDANLTHGSIPEAAVEAVAEAYEETGEEIVEEIDVFTTEATEADIEPKEADLAPMVDSAPAENSAPAVEDTPAEDSAPAVEDTPAEDSTPVADSTQQRLINQRMISP